MKLRLEKVHENSKINLDKPSHHRDESGKPHFDVLQNAYLLVFCILMYAPIIAI